MNDNRRSHEASSLRAFFDDQIQHLQALVSDLGSYIRPEPHIDEDIQIIEGFVDAANSRIRAAHHYVEKLRGHVCALYDQVLQVADQIPDPVEFSQDAFRNQPLVNALFVNSDEIDRLFQTNPDARTYIRRHALEEVPVVYALLTASKSEKSILAVGLLGDMLVRDVPQEVVNFSSHKIHKPCDCSAMLTAALRQYLFDNVVALIKQEMASRIASQSLTPSDNSYEAKINSLANPDVYLNALIEHMGNPANLLRIDKNHYRLNKMGIKLASDDTSQYANEFDIHELTWSDDTRNIVVKIAYPR